VDENVLKLTSSGRADEGPYLASCRMKFDSFLSGIGHER